MIIYTEFTLMQMLSTLLILSITSVIVYTSMPLILENNIRGDYSCSINILSTINMLSTLQYSNK